MILINTGEWVTISSKHCSWSVTATSQSEVVLQNRHVGSEFNSITNTIRFVTAAPGYLYKNK